MTKKYAQECLCPLVYVYSFGTIDSILKEPENCNIIRDKQKLGKEHKDPKGSVYT